MTSHVQVKDELQELFEFLEDVFKKQTGITIVIVALIEDLDRVLKGRNVKVLDAMQLILSVPGAPVIAVLAIDARMVVSSIEESFGTVMREDQHVSGCVSIRLRSASRSSTTLTSVLPRWQMGVPGHV